MEIGDLYNVILVIVLVGVLLGVGILILDSFAAASGVTSTAETSLNNTRDAVATISTTWLPIIVIVAAAAIVLALVVRSFSRN